MRYYRSTQGADGRWRFAQCCETGHDNGEDASVCYRDHQLDTALRVGHSSSSQRPCAECGAWTSCVVYVGAYSFESLCDQHQTMDMYKKHFPPATEIWES